MDYPFNIVNDPKISIERYNLVFSQLSERSQKIIEDYYKNFKTYREIAEEFGITPERVRQLLNIAVWKIKKEVYYEIC